jgi:diguanylate cyclase (GGDEF)-like protein
MVPEPVERILQSARLPSPPAVALQVIDLARDPVVSIGDLAQVISRDPALAARILRVANSAGFARRWPAVTIREAVMVVGLRTVKTLALGFSLADELRRGQGDEFDYDAVWRRASIAAAASALIATRTGAASRGEAFLAGLLHPLGMLVLGRAYGARYQAIFDRAAGDLATLTTLEREWLSTDHLEVGAAVAGAWSIPPALRAAIACHLDPGTSPPEMVQLVRCTAVGVLATTLLMNGGAGSDLSAYRAACADWFELDAATSEDLLAELDREAAEAVALLNLPAGGPEGTLEILSRAKEALEEIALEATSELSSLETEHRELEAVASADPLTGLANRRRLEEFIGLQCETARRTGLPVSVVMIDLDGFKQINDAYGHPAGDEVLVAVADVLSGAIRTMDLAARYGGDEFALVLPGTGREGAEKVTRRVRVGVNAVTAGLAHLGSVRVTASAGSATFQRDTCDEPLTLLRAADQAMYADKQQRRERRRGGTSDGRAA